MAGKDWLPAPRLEQLAMGKTWVSQVKVKGESVWKMEAADIAALEEAVTTADNENAVPMSLRTPVANERIRDSFDHLGKVMRGVKRRYFLVPPLTDSDMTSLGLKSKDQTPTTIEAPTKSAICDLTHPDRGVIEINKIRTSGDGGDTRSNYGVRIYYGVLGESDARDKFRLKEKPQSGSDLPHSVFTRKKSHRFDFSEDMGKAVFFALRFENSKGEVGPWSDVYNTYVS
jgi:hypothetical protein